MYRGEGEGERSWIQKNGHNAIKRNSTQNRRGPVLGVGTVDRRPRRKPLTR